MPRSNRPRSRRTPDRAYNADDELDLDRVRAGLRRTESKKSGTYSVQSVSAAQAVKVYVCPGCRTDVPIGQAHVVAWRADGPLSDDAELASRRHWHSYCWRMEP
jgi:hypothetical protein